MSVYMFDCMCLCICVFVCIYVYVRSFTSKQTYIYVHNRMDDLAKLGQKKFALLGSLFFLDALCLYA